MAVDQYGTRVRQLDALLRDVAAQAGCDDGRRG
jgi:hypothetical protein